MNILPVKSLACFKINTESLEGPWDLGATWDIRSTTTTTPVCTQRRDTLEFTIRPLSSPTTPPPACTQITCHHRSCREKKRRKKGAWRSPVRTTMQCSRKVLIAVTSQLFFQSFVATLSETIHKPFLNVDPPLWRSRRVSTDVAVEILPVQLGSRCLAPPAQVSITHNDDLRVSQSNAAPPFKARRVQSSFYRRSLQIYCLWLTLWAVRHQ